MRAPSMSVQRERSDLLEQLEKWGTFVLANVMWCLVSIPIITFPAATAGLFAVTARQARGQDPNVFAVFFGTMRRLWLNATAIVLVDVVVGGLAVFNFSVLPQMALNDPMTLLTRSMTLFVAAALIMINLYLWTLLVLVDMPLKRLLTTSVKLAFAYPAWTFGVGVVAALPIVVSLILPQGLFLIATGSACALLIHVGTRRVIRRHFPETEPPPDLVHDDV